MKRWAVCRMVEIDGSREAAVNRYRCNTRVWSKPGFNWCVVHVAAPSLVEIQADPDIYMIPDGAMDNALSTFPVATRNAMKTRLEAAGFEFASVKTTWTVRKLLIHLAKQLEPGVTSVEDGDVVDIEQ